MAGRQSQPKDMLMTNLASLESQAASLALSQLLERRSSVARRTNGRLEDAGECSGSHQATYCGTAGDVPLALLTVSGRPGSPRLLGQTSNSNTDFLLNEAFLTICRL